MTDTPSPQAVRLLSDIYAEMEGRQRGYADVRGELLFRCRDFIAASPALAAETGGEALAWRYQWTPHQFEQWSGWTVGVSDPRIYGGRRYRNVHPLYAAPPAAGGGLDREAVARILDSGVIHYRADSCRITDLNGTLLPEKYASMEKAASALIKLRTAAILALTVPEAKPEGEGA